MCSAHVSLLSRCMLRYFTSFFWGRSTLPICTVGQVWLHCVNVICMDLLWFTLILHFFTQSSILLMEAWSFIEAIARFSCCYDFSIVACVFVAMVTFLPSHCLAMIGGHIYRWMGGIYEVRCWGGLRCHNTHTRFHKDWFVHPKLMGGGGIYRHMAWSRLKSTKSLVLFCSILNVMWN
jgi:hypothetical protein